MSQAKEAAFAKFYEFVLNNYSSVAKKPAYDEDSEFLVRLNMVDNTFMWYGPIDFETLTTFADSLPSIEREAFIYSIRYEEFVFSIH